MDRPLGATRSLEHVPVRVVSARPPLRVRLAHLVQRRELLIGLVTSDIRIKYKNSALGLLWSMISPALTLLTYYMVFAIFLKNGIPNFVLYLFSGLVVWNMFLTSTSMATGVIVDRAGLVKKVSFPREILPLSNVGAAIFYFVVQLFILVIFMAAIGHPPAWSYLWVLPIAFLSLFFFTSALAIVVSAVTVYLRDVRHLMDVVLQFWWWLTPIVYSYSESIASRLHAHGLAFIYFLNPMTLIVITFQRVFYVATSVRLTTTGVVTQILPTWSVMRFAAWNGVLLAVTIVCFVLAETAFGRLEGNFESEL